MSLFCFKGRKNTALTTVYGGGGKWHNRVVPYKPE